MKSNLLILTALAITITTASAQTDILHYKVRQTLTGGENTKNRVDLQSRTTGESERQSFNLTARGLEPETDYMLVAAPRGSDEYFEAAQFTTDRKGNARLRYQNNENGNGNLEPVPDALLPLHSIGSLAILDGDSQAVLEADLTAPERLSYTVKRTLEGENGESGVLTIRGTHKRTSFNLRAANLEPESEYTLAINDTEVETYQSDRKGRLRINSLTEPVESPLDIQKVQLLNSEGGVVLETELP